MDVDLQPGPGHPIRILRILLVVVQALMLIILLVVVRRRTTRNTPLMLRNTRNVMLRTTRNHHIPTKGGPAFSHPPSPPFPLSRGITPANTYPVVDTNTISLEPHEKWRGARGVHLKPKEDIHSKYTTHNRGARPSDYLPLENHLPLTIGEPFTTYHWRTIYTRCNSSSLLFLAIKN